MGGPGEELDVIWEPVYLDFSKRQWRKVRIIQLTSPRIRQDYPLNLSILISGGKETNRDVLSNGE